MEKIDLGETTKEVIKTSLELAVKNLIKSKLVSLITSKLLFIVNPLTAVLTKFLMGRIIGPALDEIHESIVKQIILIESKKKGTALNEAKTDEEVTDAFGDI